MTIRIAGNKLLRPPAVLHFECPQCKKPFQAKFQRAFCGRQCFIDWQRENTSMMIRGVVKIDMEEETNGACLRLEGPCKFTSCRCHLASGDAGTMKWRRIPDLPYSLCAIKESAEAMTLDRVAKIMGCTRERVRQIEVKALEKIRNQEGCST